MLPGLTGYCVQLCATHVEAYFCELEYGCGTCSDLCFVGLHGCKSRLMVVNSVYGAVRCSWTSSVRRNGYFVDWLRQ
jgi:hypothetical protein